MRMTDSPRTAEQAEAAGRIDFWATYGQRSVAIELKQVPISVGATADHLARLRKKWEEVAKQAQSGYDFMRTQSWALSPASVGLLVVRVGTDIRKRARSSVEEQRVEAEMRLAELKDHVLKAIKPGFLAMYRAPQEMQIYSWEDEGNTRTALFPGMLFAACVRTRCARSR
jgi:hypothetical protein